VRLVTGGRAAETRRLILGEGSIVAGSDVETYYEDLLWKTRREGCGPSLVVSTSQSEALDAGRRTAVRDRVDHIIRDIDGRLLCRNSYRDLPNIC
jgi:hypothetical protein